MGVLDLTEHEQLVGVDQEVFMTRSLKQFKLCSFSDGIGTAQYAQLCLCDFM